MSNLHLSVALRPSIRVTAKAGDPEISPSQMYRSMRTSWTTLLRVPLFFVHNTLS